MQKGFTLAEVLITLGIIGVVAALTIPSLVNQYKKQVYYTQFRKAATNLENAFKKYEFDNGCEGSILSCKDHYTAEDIMPYFKVAQAINADNWESICQKAIEKDDNYQCFNDTADNAYTHAFITSDGMLFNLSTDQGLGNASIVDTNGPNKGPNEYGRDIFVFYSPGAPSCDNVKQIVIWGGDEEKLGCPQDVISKCDDLNNSADMQGCAARLLREGKMNY